MACKRSTKKLGEDRQTILKKHNDKIKQLIVKWIKQSFVVFISGGGVLLKCFKTGAKFMFNVKGVAVAGLLAASPCNASSCGGSPNVEVAESALFEELERNLGVACSRADQQQLPNTITEPKQRQIQNLLQQPQKLNPLLQEARLLSSILYNFANFREHPEDDVYIERIRSFLTDPESIKNEEQSVIKELQQLLKKRIELNQFEESQINRVKKPFWHASGAFVLAISTFIYRLYYGASTVGDIKNLSCFFSAILTRYTYKEFRSALDKFLAENLLRLIENPKENCRHLSSYDISTAYPLLNLTECACAADTYNRLTNERRLNFENKIIEKLNSQIQDKSQTIRLMSIGCGGLLQEAILLSRLIKEGFTSIEISLVELEAENFINVAIVIPTLIRAFKIAFPEVKISGGLRQTVEDAPNANVEKFDLIYAIDFDQAFDAYEFYKGIVPYIDTPVFFRDFNITPEFMPYISENERATPKNDINEFRTGLGDLIYAKSLLSPEGSLFIGMGHEGIEYSSRGDISLFYKFEMPKAHEIALKSVPKESSTIVMNLDEPQIPFLMLIRLLAGGYKDIHLILEESHSKTTSHEFMKKFLPEFSSEITVSIVEDVRSYIKNADVAFLVNDYLKGGRDEYTCKNGKKPVTH